MTSRRWTFTLNNPDSILDLDRPEIQYAIYQGEEGENGTFHYQGYIELTKPMRLNAVKAMIDNRAHLEIARGTFQQNEDYCSKEGGIGDPFRFGEHIGQGKRSDLSDVTDFIQSEDRPSLKRVAEEFPNQFIKFHKGIEKLIEITQPIDQFYLVPLRWQADLLDRLMQAPDDRTVMWYWEMIGGKGKSTIARYLEANFNAYIISPPFKYDRVIYQYNRQPIVIFDLPRDIEDKVPFSLFEGFKNGYFAAGMYGCSAKRFPSPHVLVFANFEPDRSRLSEDRWFIVNID